jgi:hypothetical protein
MPLREKRREKRGAFKVEGYMIDRLGRHAGHCLVVDISSGGAQLLTLSAELDDEFTLALSGSGAVKRHCRVRWRRPPHVGVQFVKGAPAPVVMVE